MKFSSSYHLGRSTEIQVSQILQKLGWKTKLSPGSKGPADMHADKNGRRWCIQVKFQGDGIRGLNWSEESQLLMHSAKCSCKPIAAIVTRYPGGLLLNASNVRDKKNPFVIRKKTGSFFAIEIDQNTALFFYNLLDGKKIEP